MSKSDYLVLAIVICLVGGLVSMVFGAGLRNYAMFSYGLLALLSIFPLGFIAVAFAEGEE